MPNVLVVTFEEMKTNLAAVVGRVTTFCGQVLSADTIEEIARQTSFQELQKNPATNREEAARMGVFDNSISTFMRKGGVGDWKNYFSSQQNEFMDNLCQTITSPLGLEYQFQ